MKIALLPLQNDELIRMRCEGLISLRGQESKGDPLQAVLGSNCFTLKVLLNLECCQGIDTSGVHWLMEIFKKFEQGRGKLVLVAVPPMVARVLDFLGASSIIPVAANDTAARELARAGLDRNMDGRYRLADDRPIEPAPSRRLPG